jgi:hypothetical protein
VVTDVAHVPDAWCRRRHQHRVHVAWCSGVVAGWRCRLVMMSVPARHQLVVARVVVMASIGRGSRQTLNEAAMPLVVLVPPAEAASRPIAAAASGLLVAAVAQTSAASWARNPPA